MEIFRQLARPFGFRNRQYETLTEVNAVGFKVRVWRTAKTLRAAESFDHREYRSQIRQVVDSVAVEDWLTALMRLDGVACVAIVDGEGCGVSGYPDWG